MLVTTPNIASHRNLGKSLRGDAPYSFGPFVPVGGVHGRHNREYVAREVQAMGEAAGFETVRLVTADVYDRRVDPEVAALLAARGEDGAMRGETIFWLGRATGRAGGDAPPGLYHGVPARLSGRLSLARRGAEGATVAATNTARADWPAEGDFAIALVLDWQDAHGRLVHQGTVLPLPRGVPSGETAEVTLAADGGRGTLTVGLFERGAGRMAGAGRSNHVRLACSEAAFLALARR